MRRFSGSNAGLWMMLASAAIAAVVAVSCTTSSKRPKPPTFTNTPTATPTATPAGVGTTTATVMQTATAFNTPTLTVTFVPPSLPSVEYFEVGSIRVRASFCGQPDDVVDGWSFNAFLRDPNGRTNMVAAFATGVPILKPTALSMQMTPDATTNDPYATTYSLVQQSLAGLFPGPTYAPSAGDTFHLVVSQTVPTPFPVATASVDFVAASLPSVTTNLCGTPPGPNFVINWTPPSSGPPPDYYVVTVLDPLSGNTVWGPFAVLPTWNWAYVEGLTPGATYALLVAGLWHTGVHPNAPDSGAHGILFTD